MRGLANGFLIGIPVVITVVSWWLGDQNERLDSLTLLAAWYDLTMATVYGIGFRRGLRGEWQRLGDAMESLEFLWSMVRGCVIPSRRGSWSFRVRTYLLDEILRASAWG